MGQMEPPRGVCQRRRRVYARETTKSKIKISHTQAEVERASRVAGPPLASKRHPAPRIYSYAPKSFASSARFRRGLSVRHPIVAQL